MTGEKLHVAMVRACVKFFEVMRARFVRPVVAQPERRVRCLEPSQLVAPVGEQLRHGAGETRHRRPPESEKDTHPKSELTS